MDAPWPQVPDQMAVTEREFGPALVLSVTGEIDMTTSETLSEAIAAALRSGRPLIIDLTTVAFLGSAGLAVLLQATQDAPAPLPIVVDGNRPVIRPLEVTGLDRVLDLYHTVDEALAAALAHQER